MLVCQLLINRVPLPRFCASPCHTVSCWSPAGNGYSPDKASEATSVRKSSRHYPVSRPLLTLCSFGPGLPLAATTQPSCQLVCWGHPWTDLLLPQGLSQAGSCSTALSAPFWSTWSFPGSISSPSPPWLFNWPPSRHYSLSGSEREATGSYINGLLIPKIKSDIQRWNLIYYVIYYLLCLSSHTESIRMNILPRMLSLFQCLPVKVPPKQFLEWDRLIARFL